MKQIITGALSQATPTLNSLGTVSYAAWATLTGANHKGHLTGHVWLEDPTSGPKTLSAAGGGEIYWRTGTMTFANAGTTLRIGLQTPDTSSYPFTGDGTFDVYADLVGGTDTLSSDTDQVTAMESGSITLSQSDHAVIVFETISRGGADSVVIAYSTGTFHGSSTFSLPSTVRDEGAGMGLSVISNALVMLKFDDGTIGWLAGATPWFSGTNIAFNQSTGTANEYGQYFELSSRTLICGALGRINRNLSAVYELILYSDPLSGSPTIVQVSPLDSTASRSGTSAVGYFPFTPVWVPAGAYALAVRPTNINPVSVYAHNTPHSKFKLAGGLAENTYCVRRMYGSGAFSEYNLAGVTYGTVLALSPLVGGYDAPSGNAAYYLGV